MRGNITTELVALIAITGAASRRLCHRLRLPLLDGALQAVTSSKVKQITGATNSSISKALRVMTPPRLRLGPAAFRGPTLRLLI